MKVHLKVNFDHSAFHLLDWKSKMATNRVQLQLHPFCNGSRKVRHKIGLAAAVLNRAVEGRIHSLPIKSGGKFELLKACVFKE